MTSPVELPPSTSKSALPYFTIVGLLIPLAAVALLFGTTRSARTQEALTGGQKLHELQAAEERQLTTYEWIEKPSEGKPGVVRIPAERAKELILKEAAARSQRGNQP